MHASGAPQNLRPVAPVTPETPASGIADDERDAATKRGGGRPAPSRTSSSGSTIGAPGTVIAMVRGPSTLPPLYAVTAGDELFEIVRGWTRDGLGPVSSLASEHGDRTLLIKTLSPWTSLVAFAVLGHGQLRPMLVLKNAVALCGPCTVTYLTDWSVRQTGHGHGTSVSFTTQVSKVRSASLIVLSGERSTTEAVFESAVRRGQVSVWSGACLSTPVLLPQSLSVVCGGWTA